ncbi:hypothetical protein PR048_002751 [Dryococelus australis]|uniref:Uncharacterized protein n=1 Tax=Dryococelus australis TaxID=614101 RepID=A0ABQ9IL22_9NEOP|nr:hypothetical protein PR048_002751 [Dryococelus australis]
MFKFVDVNCAVFVCLSQWKAKIGPAFSRRCQTPSGQESVTPTFSWNNWHQLLFLALKSADIAHNRRFGHRILNGYRGETGTYNVNYSSMRKINGAAGGQQIQVSQQVVDIAVRAVRRPALKYGWQSHLKGACASNLLTHKPRHLSTSFSSPIKSAWVPYLLSPVAFLNSSTSFELFPVRRGFTVSMRVLPPPSPILNYSTATVLSPASGPFYCGTTLDTFQQRINAFHITLINLTTSVKEGRGFTCMQQPMEKRRRLRCGGKRESPEKTHRPAASYRTIATCETPPGKETGSPRSERRLLELTSVSLVGKAPSEFEFQGSKAGYVVDPMRVARGEWRSNASVQGRGKRETPEKTSRSAALSGVIPSNESPVAIPPPRNQEMLTLAAGACSSRYTTVAPTCPLSVQASLNMRPSSSILWERLTNENLMWQRERIGPTIGIYPSLTNLLYQNDQTNVHCFPIARNHEDPGSIPGGFAPGFSRVGFVLDDTVCRGGGGSSGFTRFLRPCIPAPLCPRVSFHVMSGDERAYTDLVKVSLYEAEEYPGSRTSAGLQKRANISEVAGDRPTVIGRVPAALPTSIAWIAADGAWRMGASGRFAVEVRSVTRVTPSPQPGSTRARRPASLPFFPGNLFLVGKATFYTTGFVPTPPSQPRPPARNHTHPDTTPGLPGIRLELGHPLLEYVATQYSLLVSRLVGVVTFLEKISRQVIFQNTVESFIYLYWLKFSMTCVNCLHTNHAGAVPTLPNSEWPGQMWKRFSSRQQPMAIDKLLLGAYSNGVYRFQLPEDDFSFVKWGCCGIVGRPLASQLGEQGSIPGGDTPGFSYVLIVPDDAADRTVFSESPASPYPCIPAPLYTHLASPSSALKTSISKRTLRPGLAGASKGNSLCAQGTELACMLSSCNVQPTSDKNLRTEFTSGCEGVHTFEVEFVVQELAGSYIARVCDREKPVNNVKINGIERMDCRCVMVAEENFGEFQKKNADSLCNKMLHALLQQLAQTLDLGAQLEVASWNAAKNGGCAKRRCLLRLYLKAVVVGRNVMSRQHCRSRQRPTERQSPCRLLRSRAIRKRAYGNQYLHILLREVAAYILSICSIVNWGMRIENHVMRATPALAGGVDDDKIEFKRVYAKVTFAIGSEFIRHALDDSAPIVDLQESRTVECGITLGQQPMNKQLMFDYTKDYGV